MIATNAACKHQNQSRLIRNNNAHFGHHNNNIIFLIGENENGVVCFVFYRLVCFDDGLKRTAGMLE
jgi:hypothetical protein